MSILGTGTMPTLEWLELLQYIVLTPEDIVQKTIFNEGGYSVEEFAEWADRHYPGILRCLCEAYLNQYIKPLLEEALLLDDEVLTVLSDPRSHFVGDAEQDTRDRVTAHFDTNVNEHSPQHVIRAMIAFIERGLGNFTVAMIQGTFARNEKAIPNFEEHMANADATAIKATCEEQLLVASLLVPLLREFRMK